MRCVRIGLFVFKGFFVLVTGRWLLVNGLKGSGFKVQGHSIWFLATGFASLVNANQKPVARDI